MANHLSHLMSFHLSNSISHLKKFLLNEFMNADVECLSAMCKAFTFRVVSVCGYFGRYMLIMGQTLHLSFNNTIW